MLEDKCLIVLQERTSKIIKSSRMKQIKSGKARNRSKKLHSLNVKINYYF